MHRSTQSCNSPWSRIPRRTWFGTSSTKTRHDPGSGRRSAHRRWLSWPCHVPGSTRVASAHRGAQLLAGLRKASRSEEPGSGVPESARSWRGLERPVHLRPRALLEIVSPVAGPWFRSTATPTGTVPSFDSHLLDEAPRAAAALPLEGVPSEGTGSDVRKDPAFGAQAPILLLQDDLTPYPSSDEPAHGLLVRGDPGAPPSPEMGIVVPNGRPPRTEPVRAWIDRSPDILNGSSSQDPIEVHLAGRAQA